MFLWSDAGGEILVLHRSPKMPLLKEIFREGARLGKLRYTTAKNVKKFAYTKKYVTWDLALVKLESKIYELLLLGGFYLNYEWIRKTNRENKFLLCQKLVCWCWKYQLLYYVRRDQLKVLMPKVFRFTTSNSNSLRWYCMLFQRRQKTKVQRFIKLAC